MSATPEQLGDLAWRYLDASGDHESDRAFAQAMRDDPALVDVFAAMCLTRQTLAETIGCKGSVTAFLESRDEPALAIVEPTGAGRHALRWALAASVLIGGLLVAAIALSGDDDNPIEPQPEGRPIAVLMRSERVSWEREPIYEGDDVTTGPIAIASGHVKMRLHSGVSVAMHGPARLDMRDAMHGRLQSGRMLARVPDGVDGFRIDTPDLSVVDLGTEFGIEVDAAGASVVHVFDGRVRVERGDETIEVAAGRSASLVDGRLVAGASDFARFPEATLPGGRLVDLAFTADDPERLRLRGATDVLGEDSLEHPFVAGRGGHLTLEGSTTNRAVFIDLDTSLSGAFAEAQVRTDDGHIGRDGSRIYIAWLMRGTFGENGFAGVSLFNGGDTDVRDEPLFIGKAHGIAAMSYHTEATGEQTIDALPATPTFDPAAPDGRPTLVVVRIDFAAETDRVSIWLDPDIEAEEQPDTPNARFELASGTFDRLRLAAGSGAGLWAFDELRMSGNWSDLGSPPLSAGEKRGDKEND